VSLPRVILIRVSTPQGWSEADGALQREFSFANFADALAFVNRVGALAEAENHHPDVELGWGRVVLRWRTHSADAITDRDRELAEKSGRL
jgi:4a-hydroxytetrahydrobiopterin dehydratase